MALTNYAFIESAVANRHFAHVRSYNACHRSIADPYLVGKLMKSAIRIAGQYEQYCPTIINKVQTKTVYSVLTNYAPARNRQIKG